MSLDVYLYVSETRNVFNDDTKFFARRNDERVELTLEQVQKKFPKFEITQNVINYENCVFEYNITHNLGKMARECGLYEVIWRPYRLHKDFYEGMEYEDELDFEEENLIKASDLEKKLFEGYNELIKKPEHYKKFNPENNWGTYEGFVEFVGEYHNAVKNNPDAIVKVSL